MLHAARAVGDNRDIAVALVANSSAQVLLNTTAPSDSTPPSIEPTITGTRGPDGWYTSDVHLTSSVTDNQSAITSQTGCDAVDVTTDQQSTTYTCTATSAGGTAIESVTIKRDATAPYVTLTGVEDGAVYGADAVPEAGCVTEDATSGVATDATASIVPGATGTSPRPARAPRTTPATAPATLTSRPPTWARACRRSPATDRVPSGPR